MSINFRRRFFVLATQNPIELEGTYPLRRRNWIGFCFNAVLDYLSASDELKVVDLTTATKEPESDGGDEMRRSCWSFSSWCGWCRSGVRWRSMW